MLSIKKLGWLIKVSLAYLALILLSPFIVLWGQEYYTVTGWMAIGWYDFDTYDGLYRSLYFYVFTLPVILALYLSIPSYKQRLEFPLVHIKIPFKFIIYMMMLFSLVCFSYDLGITGVENDTGGWRISGIVHYLRSYIFVLFVAIYIFSTKKSPVTLVILYSLVIGLTSASRFAGVTVLFVLIIRLMLDSKETYRYMKVLVVLLSVLIIFNLITAFRLVTYAEGYTFSRFIPLFETIDFDMPEVIFQGVNQLWLRIGIGRDVILSYQVQSDNICNNLTSFFYSGHSCSNPPLDFYGLVSDNNKFYLAAPVLSNLVAIPGGWFDKIFISMIFSLMVYFCCKVLLLCRYIPYGDVLINPLYFIFVIFFTIGPIYFVWYILVALLLLVALLGVVKGKLYRGNAL